MRFKSALANNLDALMNVEVAKAREEGRREVLREIAAFKDPMIGEDNQCGFCHGYTHHEPNCLWLRAQAVKA